MWYLLFPQGWYNTKNKRERIATDAGGEERSVLSFTERMLQRTPIYPSSIPFRVWMRRLAWGWDLTRATALCQEPPRRSYLRLL